MQALDGMNLLLDVPVAAPAPFAHIFGEPVLELPHDLYIPPDALRVLLESFGRPARSLALPDPPPEYRHPRYPDGGGDGAIHAVRRGHEGKPPGAGCRIPADGFTLIEIKSRLLLPKPAAAQDEEHDPRAELARRFNVEQMKLAAFELDQLPQAGRDFAWAAVVFEKEAVLLLPDVSAADLESRVDDDPVPRQNKRHHTVKADELSVREQMSHILKVLAGGRYVEFVDLFDHARGVPMLVVTFTALLELVKEKMITVSQEAAGMPIYARLAGVEEGS